MKDAPSLPKGFVYPIGYIPPDSRIHDEQVLAVFEAFEHPYIVAGHDGNPTVDPHAPVAVRRLRNGRCVNLDSSIRFLEIGGSPDASMEATYQCEDVLKTACDYSEAGFRQTAVEIIRGLPEPFQRTAPALEALVESFMALSRHDDALREVRLLVQATDVPTEYARTLHRINEVQLLLTLGRLQEAESIMDQRRSEFHGMYQYYGVRAALALAQGNEPLARALVVKSGRIDSYHCYKLLWNPLLKPLEAFIKAELLTEDNKPRIDEQNGQMRRLIHSVQGAMLRYQMDRAKNIAEGILCSRISEWSCAHEAFLAFFGLGFIDQARRWSCVLPGCRLTGNRSVHNLVKTVAEMFDGTSAKTRATWVEEMCACDVNEAVALAFYQLVEDFRSDQSVGLSYGIESRIAEVAGKWTSDGRDLWLLSSLPETGFRLVLMREPRQRRLDSRDPREIFPLVEEICLTVGDAAVWIEDKLKANVGVKVEMYSANPFRFEFNGWALLRSFREPDLNEYPHLLANWKIAADDPNYYFSNGILFSYGMRTPFAERLYQSLYLFLSHRECPR